MRNLKNFSLRPGFAGLLLLFFAAGCIDSGERPQRLPHNFKQGKADNLYHISDLIGAAPVLSKEGAAALYLAPEDLQAQKRPAAAEKQADHARAGADSAGQRGGSAKQGRETQPPQSIGASGAPSAAAAFPPLSISKGGFPRAFQKEGRKALLRVRTAAKGQKAAISFAQENISIDPNISFINEYEFLGYTIKGAEKTRQSRLIARLLGKVERFKGFPNTDYYILPVFEGNYLILYKLAPYGKIPYDELPLAKRAGEMLAVPLVGYKVEYCLPEIVPDLNDRKTGQYLPACEGSQIQYAPYVRLNEGKKQVFAYQPKPDLFPRDFFERSAGGKEAVGGQRAKWFYVRTVTQSPDKAFEGHQPFVPSNLVEFYPAGGKLDVLDASGSDIKEDDKKRALFIPVEWVDYQIKRDSENPHPEFTEEAKTNLYDQDLRYFKIKFAALVENEIEYRGKKTLKKAVITDDYLSFDVEITGKESGAYLIRFAFFKEPRQSGARYVPKQWFERDSSQFFPSFAEQRRFYKKSEDHSEADHERFLRLTRFNPQAGEIKWHFSTQTPSDGENKWVRELGRLAIQLVNSALAEAGKGSPYSLKAVLDESEDKEVGDIRYNILNLVVSEGKPKSGLLGLGPNVANPITGEALSATANVWISNILSVYTQAVQKYIRFQVYPPAWSMRPFSREMQASLQKRIDKKAPQCGALPFKPQGATVFMHEKIQSLCPEAVEFIRRQRENGPAYDPENPDLEDSEAVKSCGRKIAFLPILGVTLHEILHGFAQRHIFSASADSENFYKSYDEMQKIFGAPAAAAAKRLFGDLPFAEGTKCHPHPPQYSSVMDYMSLYNPVLFVPGKMDIAALRFIYFDRVDLKNGEALQVPAGADTDPQRPQKSILDTAALQGLSKEDIKGGAVLCGGERSGPEANPDQPLCAIFDYGENPLEASLNSILEAHAFMDSGRLRYDSQRPPRLIEKKARLLKSHIGDLLKKWMRQRDDLLKSQSPERAIEDFPFFSAKARSDYQNIIESESSEEFKMYREMRGPVFDYFQRAAFMPVKRCVYRRLSENGGFLYSAEALESVIDKAKGNYLQYPEGSRERAISCASPFAQNWARENGKGELIAQPGFFGQDMKYFLRPRASDSTDETSAFELSDELTHRPLISKNPFLDMLLEPDLGAAFFKEAEDYMLYGANLNPYIDEKARGVPRDESGQASLPRFLTYKMDESASSGFNGGNVNQRSFFHRRLSAIEEAVKKLKSQAKNSQALSLRFESKSLSLVELGRMADSIENGGSGWPFLTEARQLYTRQSAARAERRSAYLAGRERELSDDSRGQGAAPSFSAFIKSHPAVFYREDGGGSVVIPYQDAEENLPARLFRRFNEFWSCIKNQGEERCPDYEDKAAFVKIMRERMPK